MSNQPFEQKALGQVGPRCDGWQHEEQSLLFAGCKRLAGLIIVNYDSRKDVSGTIQIE